MLFNAIARVRELYEAPGRHYHGWGHVEDCLEKALRVGCSSRVLLALLYHDVIYRPGEKAAGRRAFLESLLAKDRIFYSVPFALNEANARANIARKISELSVPSATHGGGAVQ